MRINNISNISYTNQPSFLSAQRVYKSSCIAKNVFSTDNIYTTTGPFRRHIKNWQKFIKDLCIDHFKNTPKVNIYSLGCSDGSEALSYAISLADMLPAESLKKYFPIIAYDIDSEIIEAASTGKINLDGSDLQRIAKNTLNVGRNSEGIFTGENLLRKFENPIRIEHDLNQDEEVHSIFNPLNSYAPTGPIKDSVKFGVWDVLSAVKNIRDEGNSIVNISHTLGYCTKDYTNEVTQALGEKLKKGSLYVFDEMHNTSEYWQQLEKLGFCAPYGKEHCIAEKIN